MSNEQWEDVRREMLAKGDGRWRLKDVGKITAKNTKGRENE
jgi:hypothetical protein